MSNMIKDEKKIINRALSSLTARSRSDLIHESAASPVSFQA